MLLEHQVFLEEFGGHVQAVPISALKVIMHIFGDHNCFSDVFHHHFWLFIMLQDAFIRSAF